MKVKKQSFETDAPVAAIAQALGAAWTASKHRAVFPIHEVEGGYRLATDPSRYSVDYSVHIVDDRDHRSVTTQLHSASTKRELTVFFIPLSPRQLSNPSAYYGVMKATRKALERAGHQVTDTTTKVKWP